MPNGIPAYAKFWVPSSMDNAWHLKLRRVSIRPGAIRRIEALRNDPAIEHTPGFGLSPWNYPPKPVIRK